ncbi:MAG: GNAT family N-acetyltransferase [Clostridia bacterium]|nr:GNAT family N-acetyltransferase [Clostridia bacterium]
MADMLVKLYSLPDSSELYRKLKEKNIDIVRATSCDRDRILDWIRENFGSGWAGETAIAFGSHPISCIIAIDRTNRQILGFAGYDCTCKDYFGPTGVSKEARGQGIGSALLLRTLEAMRDESYAYAIIGAVGPVDFYQKTVGAQLIENGDGGIYRNCI